MSYTPTIIDLSRVPAPNAIEALDFEVLRAQFVERFKAYWAARRAADPSLPDYDVEMLETDPAMIVGQAWSFLRLHDRGRVNDAVKAVLAPLAKGADLDNVVARANVVRLVVTPADPQRGTPDVYESDAQLLRRYLLGFDAPSAGSADRYLFEAYTAVPSLHDVAVIGRAIHGRRGDTDVVIVGKDGSAPTTEEILAVKAAVSADDVKPEAVGVIVVAAKRTVYSLSLVIEVGQGPDMALVEQEARDRVLAVTEERKKIGAEVPPELAIGAAYGPNVLRARWQDNFTGIAPEPYTIPICSGVVVSAERRA